MLFERGGVSGATTRTELLSIKTHCNKVQNRHCYFVAMHLLRVDIIGHFLGPRFGDVSCSKDGRAGSSNPPLYNAVTFAPIIKWDIVFCISFCPSSSCLGSDTTFKKTYLLKTVFLEHPLVTVGLPKICQRRIFLHDTQEYLFKPHEQL